MAPLSCLHPKISGTYEHSSLEGPKFSFRSLLLLPGRRGSPIRINIDTFTFEQDAHPPYEALSYAWGDPTDTVPIIVFEGGLCLSLNVTRNCKEALGYLRLEKRPRRLWIDAICINQRDDEEKNMQVFKMIEVYREARQVIAWLGPADATTSIAFDWIRTVNRNVIYNRTQNALVLKPGGNKRYLAARGTAVVDKDQILALRSLIHKPWFTRLWVWQEVNCKTKHAILKCGGHVITWQDFSISIEYLGGKTIVLVDIRHLMLIQGLSSALDIGDLYELMDAMRNAHCSDPRDRIYVAEALRLHADNRLRPNYSEGWRSVYTHWAERRIACGFLSVLRYAGAFQASTELPSWVPNWSEKSLPGGFVDYFANGGAQPVCTLQKGGLLDVCGVRVSKIQTLVKFRPTYTNDGIISLSAVLDFLRQLIRLGLVGNREPDHVTRCARTLNAGRIADHFVLQNAAFPSLKRVTAAIENFIASEPGKESDDAEASAYKVLAMDMWPGRAFFLKPRVVT